MVCLHQQSIHTNHSRICSDCGVENIFLKMDTYNIFSAPILKSYDRTQRFLVKLDKLLLIHSGPNIKDPIWAVLKKQCFKTPRDIRFFLRHYKNLKTKHYDCIRLFSKLFANFNIKPKKSVHEIRANVNKHFASLLYDWKRVCDEGLFFSTDWLMRKYVKKFCFFLSEHRK